MNTEPPSQPIVWDGKPTEFVLARPLIHRGVALDAGDDVSFDVMPHPQFRGVFVGDEADHVMDLYHIGAFAFTVPAADRLCLEIDSTGTRLYDGVE